MAKTSKQSQSGNQQNAASGVAGGAIEMLKQDHRKVERLFEEFGKSSDDHRKEELAEQICSELIIHTKLEEEMFYPACRKVGVEEHTMDEAQVEHDGAKVFINDLLDSQPDEPFWEAKVSVLRELVKHHIQEEEKPGQGAFAQATAHGIDDKGLAEQLKHLKEELQERGIGRRPVRVVSLQPEGGMGYGGGRQGERRYGGRHSREEEYGYGRGGGYRSRGGWYGDPEGHSEAARERWGEGRRGSRYEEEYGERSRGREGDYEGRSHGGWSGDPRGHAEAARRGWDERRGDYEDSRRYGRSARDDDDDDRRGHSGWYGDSRQHAEASRRGWQHRR